MAQLSTTLRDAPHRGTCRLILMAGTLRVRTAEKTTLKPWGRGAPFPCGDQSFLRQRLVSHPVASLAPLRLTALPHSKLDTLWHNRCAGGAPFPYRHPSFLRQRRVSAWVASLATLGCSPCVTACHPTTRATLIAHSSPPRLCTYAVVMPSSPMLGGGSNHHDGSNGIESR